MTPYRKISRMMHMMRLASVPELKVFYRCLLIRPEFFSIWKYICMDAVMGKSE
uniref:Uncharacterized protein n=1 Tax=Anguilla anguilla TaxID=7936 RepID=A0A0E9PL51_ANGAN